MEGRRPYKLPSTFISPPQEALPYHTFMKTPMTFALPCGVTSARTSLGTSIAIRLDAFTIAKTLGASSAFWRVGKRMEGEWRESYNHAKVQLRVPYMCNTL